MHRFQRCTMAFLCAGFAAAGAAGPLDTLAFHRDARRTGWNDVQTELTRARVSADSFGLKWESPPLDEFEHQAPRLYASPLYVDRVQLTAGAQAGRALPVVFAATNHGFVYAISASGSRGVPPGSLLWRAQLGTPCKLEPRPLDGVPTGVLATPVIDLARQRIYVTSCELRKRWQAYALDLGSGAVLPGWPVLLDEATFNRPGMNRNAGPQGSATPPRRFDYRVQRGALNLSPDGARLYVTFGETSTGWLVSVDTVHARVDSAFATVAKPHRSNGGIWGAGGAAVDARGNVFVVTGTGFSGFVDQTRDWVQSVLMLAHLGADGFALRGTYTPFNHCATAAMDIDLGSGGVTLLPDLDAAATATPQLMAIGGKQGNVYLIDRARMPGALDRRPPCSSDASTDASLLAPENQPQFGTRGPLNVFGPYTENDAAMDSARARSLPGYFRDRSGAHYLFVTGSTKQAAGSPVSVAPSLARLELVLAPAEPAYLRIDQLEQTLVFENPGSPVITSNASAEAIVWVLDVNARRSTLLTGENAPRPVLYALDAMTFELLWKSPPGELHTSGKYNEPVFAHGSVFVGTDRIQAFGPVDHRRSGTSAGNAVRPSGETKVDRPGGVEDQPATRDPATIDAEALYRARCAACHENAEGSVPPRELIASLPHEHIVEVLSRGSMRPMAEGLSAGEIEALARYLR
jgi:hypothetical protein